MVADASSPRGSDVTGPREPYGLRAGSSYEDGAPSFHDRTVDELRGSVEAAEIGPLLCALAHLSGDVSLLAERFRPNVTFRPQGPARQGGLHPDVLREARELALSRLIAVSQRRGAIDPVPGDAADDPFGRERVLLDRILNFMVGDIDDRVRPLLHLEIDVPHDAGAPDWTADCIAPDRPLRVAIIGAGMSGLLAAHRLSQAGIAPVVFEKNGEIGGTWWENSYPGCRLDTPNFAYSYSFAPKSDRPHEFSEQETILEYFKAMAERFEVRQYIRFRSEVTLARFDEDDATWAVTSRAHGAELTTEHFDLILSCVGQLNQPKMPDIPGMDAFQGDSWHTARWPDDIDLKGKRVAVVGTGASAYQVVPAILDDVAAMVVFQRTPPWVLPTPTYFDEISDAHRFLLDGLPHYARWFRLYQFWTSVVGRWNQVRVDPDFKHPVSISEANEGFRRVLVEHLERQFEDHPDLLLAAVPKYPPGAKRMLRDNGAWPAAMKDSRVDLELRPIAEIDRSGILLTDGTKHEVDVIIYATGFRASAFLTPIQVIGRGDRNLHAWWNGDARAYRGMSVPGFPNLLFLYGPNTNLVVNGSLIVFAEAEMNYALEHLRTLLTSGARALDVTEEAFESYNTMIDAENRQMAWGASDVSSWYKNEVGRVSQNWPLSLVDFFEQTRSIDLTDHVVVEPRRGH